MHIFFLSNNFLYLAQGNQGEIIIINYDISLLQLLLCKKHSKVKRMHGCNCSFVMENGPLN